METRDDVVIGTFCSQTKLIVDLAVESAASVGLRFDPEAEERQVRRKTLHLPQPQPENRHVCPCMLSGIQVEENRDFRQVNQTSFC